MKLPILWGKFIALLRCDKFLFYHCKCRNWFFSYLFLSFCYRLLIAVALDDFKLLKRALSARHQHYELNFLSRGVLTSCYMGHYRWAALREKIPYVLSRCHTKGRMGACGRAHLSFGMIPTFLYFFKFLFIYFFFFLSRCHTKRRASAAMRAYPSFVMTMTQDIRDLFM